MSKNTSFVLGEHFDGFVKALIDSGRYANATDAVRSGLRLLEEHEQKVEVLRRALIAGEDSGPDVPLDMESIIRNARAKARLDA